ncbi:uncharacterized protein METZ01_LOCUS384906 [marine metagenome]|uniref:Uncharacterized protein n=1 Tax=marine metagenome TaxID=408172 RepID=A0A382UD83_9ZZZZ
MGNDNIYLSIFIRKFAWSKKEMVLEEYFTGRCRFYFETV